MAVNFIISNDKTFVEKLPEGIKVPELKAKLYSLEYARDTGFYLLDIAERYTLPEKTYGNYEGGAKRIIKTHYNKKGNTGILLTGLKGTGKTLFMKFIANAMIDLNVPVIQINKAYSGEDVFNFIESIGNCVLVFDEFAKNYRQYDNGNGATQVSLLSLLDGLGNSKRMHLFTENDMLTVSEYLINRPGRVHYHYKHNRLGDDIIVEFCKDNDVPEEIIGELLELTSKLTVLSFDIISCLINEWKLHGGSLTEHLKVLNISLCKDPNEERIKLLSITTKEGKPVNIKNAYVDFRGREIYVRTDHHSENIYIDEAVYIKDNIYKFINNMNEEMVFEINAVRY